MSDRALLIRVLAPPAVEDPDGNQLQVPIGKPLALLIYLAHHPQGVPREALAELLWPDSSRSRRRASLRQALWSLKKPLDPEIFQDGDPLALAPGRVTTDLQLLTQHLEGGELDQALALWDAAPFQHFTRIDASPWEDWAEQVRIQSERRLAGALLSAGHQALSLEGPDQALTHFEEAVAVEPHRQEAHEALIECLILLRRLDEAEAAIVRAGEGVEGKAPHASDPEGRGSRFEELVQRIQSARRQGPMDEDGGNEKGWKEDGAPLPLVGREKEYERVLGLWSQARRQQAQVATLVAEAGLGRSRLAREIATAVELDGGRVVRLQALEGNEELEWSALAELTRKLMSVPGAAGVSLAAEQILSGLAPSRARSWTSHGEGVVNQRPGVVADALGDLVAAIADESPLFLLVEDAHWMDRTSLQILVQTLRRLGRARVLALITSRETVSASPLSRSLNRLTGSRPDHALTLSRWTGGEVEAVVDHTFPENPSEERAELALQLHEVSQGHVGVAVALLPPLQARSEEGEPAPLTLPGDMVDDTTRTLRHLEPRARQVAVAIQRQGGRATTTELSSQLPLPSETLLPVLDRLFRGGLLRRPAHGAVAVSHPQLLEQALARLSPEEVDPRPRWPRRRALVGGAVAVILLLVTPLVALNFLPESEPAPYGGGTLFLISPEQVEAVTPTRETVESWPRGDLTPDLGAGQYPVVPFPTEEGDVGWIVRSQGPTEKPWLMARVGDATWELYRSEGDDFANDVRPDGGAILVASEPRDAPSYRMDLYAAPLQVPDGNDATVLEATMEERALLLRGDDTLNDIRFSPDGRRIALRLNGAQDSLAVIDPAGNRRLTVPAGRLRGVAWCGDSERLLVNRIMEGAGVIQEVDLATGDFHDLPIPGPAGSTLACSPDGSAVVFPAAVEGHPLIVLQELTSQRWEPLAFGATAVPSIRWLPEAPLPIPVDLEIGGTESDLAWGEARSLGAHVHYSDGMVRSREEVEWHSDDPGVASVSPSGLLHANGLGTTTIRAVWDGWLEASLEVSVDGEVGAGAALWDDFQELGAARWAQVGWPPARIVEREGDRVLLLPGDALHRDGIITRRSWQAPRGATVEMEFRLPLTLTEKQWFWLCLVEGDLPPELEQGFELHDLSIRQRACFQYPRGSRSSFDPTQGRLQTFQGFDPMELDLAPHLPTDDWTHVALQLRADGQVSVYVNRELAGVSPIHVQNHDATQWRIMIIGSSWETEVLARDLNIWEGTRY